LADVRDHEPSRLSIAVPHQEPVWRRALVLLLVCGSLASVATSSEVHGAALRLIAVCESIIGAHPLAGPVVFVAFAAASAMLAFLSVAVVVPIAAYAWGVPLAILYLWMGWILGGTLSYAFGRTLGRSLLVWLSPATSRRVEQLLRRDGSFGFALLLQLSLPSELLGYALGSMRYRFGSYLFVVAIGEAPFAIGAVVLGENFLAGKADVLTLAGVTCAALMIVALRLLNRRIAAHTAAPNACQP
jgi:uncharacterized membrane protein YdjX (TVP38/TMEM64 family)